MNSYLFWPEGPAHLSIFQIVSDDVGFLEKQAHWVCQLRVPSHFWILQLGGREEPGQADADETGNVVAVLHRSQTDNKAVIIPARQ